jgi:hypothetical protein
MKQTLLRSLFSCLSSKEARLNMRKFLLILIVSIAGFFVFVPRGVVYAKTYHGQVLDEETGKPLEGAVVVVVWHTRPIIAMDAPEYFHDAKEALTDAQGRFRMEASPAIEWNPFTVIKKPNIAIFQPGYEPFALLRPLTRQGFKSFEDVDRALQKGATIKLPPLKTQEQLKKSGLDIAIGEVPSAKIPNLIRVINVQRKTAGLTSFIY